MISLICPLGSPRFLSSSALTSHSFYLHHSSSFHLRMASYLLLVALFLQPLLPVHLVFVTTGKCTPESSQPSHGMINHARTSIRVVCIQISLVCIQAPHASVVALPHVVLDFLREFLEVTKHSVGVAHAVHERLARVAQDLYHRHTRVHHHLAVVVDHFVTHELDLLRIHRSSRILQRLRNASLQLRNVSAHVLSVDVVLASHVLGGFLHELFSQILRPVPSHAPVNRPFTTGSLRFCSCHGNPFSHPVHSL